MEVIKFYELVKVHGKHFERQNQMLPENETIDDSDYVTFVVGVFLFKTLEDGSLNETLLVESLFVPQNFESHHLARLVVQALEHLPERAFTNVFLYLIPVAKMIFNITYKLPFIIIKASVINPVRCL